MARLSFMPFGANVLQGIIFEGRLRFTKAIELLKLHYLILMMLLETMFPWEIANMQFIRIKFTKAFLRKWKKSSRDNSQNLRITFLHFPV